MYSSHADSHLFGKRHLKMVKAAGSFGTGECYVWRPAAAAALPVAAPEPPPEALPALTKVGRAKGQTTKWEKVEKKKAEIAQLEEEVERKKAELEAKEAADEKKRAAEDEEECNPCAVFVSAVAVEGEAISVDVLEG